jgi:hypothetical protein
MLHCSAKECGCVERQSDMHPYGDNPVKTASRFTAACVLVAATALLGNDSGRSANAASSAGGAAGAVTDNEHFTVRTIIDRQQGGLTLAAFMAPAGWPDRSQVIWNYANTSNPVTAAVKVENPTSLEAFYLFQSLDMFWLQPDTRHFGNGQNAGGLLHQRPIPPAATLAAFIHFRQNVSRHPRAQTAGLLDSGKSLQRCSTQDAMYRRLRVRAFEAVQT